MLESLQRDTTIETVRRKYGLSNSVIQRWRSEFFKLAEAVFADNRSPKQRALASGYEPGQSPDELKKGLAQLT